MALSCTQDTLRTAQHLWPSLTTAGGLQHGDVITVIIPRPATEGVNPSGVGKVIVEFTEVTSAVKARNALHGRKFSGRTVTVDYIPEAAYSAGDLD